MLYTVRVADFEFPHIEAETPEYAIAKAKRLWGTTANYYFDSDFRAFEEKLCTTS